MAKVIFMGTPDFAKESLEALYEAGHNILGVVTNPDRPKGRGMKMIFSPVKEYAVEKGIKVYQPEKVRNNNEFIKEMQLLNPDFICVVAYGKILPKEILDIPQKGCINVHGSLLPKYRGAAPIQWAVLNGDKSTGVTTIYMDVGMDTGDMILKEEIQIGEDETTGELWQRMAKLGAKLLVDTLSQIENGVAPREKQGNEFSIAPMLEKQMAQIDWKTKNAIEIKNLVRGLNPIMGAYSYLNGKKIKFWKVNILTLEDFIKLFPSLANKELKIKESVSGTVIFSGNKEGLYIKANDGIIEVVELQAENAKRMNIYDFLRGNKVDIGNIFEK